nr:hypothetical protein [Tanacetum cinerariifolium]
MPRECLAIIESKSKVRYSCKKLVFAKVSTNTSFGVSPDVAKLKDMVKALLLDKKSQNQAPATVKAVEESCVTCGGTHSYRNCPATDGNVYRDNIQEFVSKASAVNYNHGNTSYRPHGFPPVPNNQNVQLNQRNNQNPYQPPAYQAPAPQTQDVSKEDFSAYIKANDAVMKNMQTQGQNMQNQLTNLIDLLTIFVNSNNASTLSTGTLPSNTIANPRSDLKVITTRSGVSYDGPQILPPPYFLPKVVENEPEATKDTVHPTNNESTEDVQPPIVQSKSLILTSEPVNSLTIEHVTSPVSASRPNLRPSIPFPSRLQDQKLRDKANDQPPLNEHYSAVLLKKLPEKLGDPELADHSISHPVRVAEDVYVKVGSFHFLIDFVVIDFDADPRVPLILGRSFLKTERTLIDVFDGELTLCVGKEAITFNLDQTSRYSANYSDMTAKRIDVIDMVVKSILRKFWVFLIDFLLEDVDEFLAIEDDPTSPEELKIRDAKSDKSSIDESPEVELKDLPPYLEYAFLEGNDKLPVIIAKDLSVEEKTALVTVLKSHKRAIAWKLSDIKGIDHEFCTHKILMEEDFEPAVQHQRRVNPKIHDVIKQDVIKLLDAGLIYPISDSPWVSLVHCVPKKGGFIVVENKDNELISTRLVTGWRVCIDYNRKPFPFILQASFPSFNSIFHIPPRCDTTRIGSLMEKIICDLNKTPDLSQRPHQNCPKYGNPVDGHYCQGCTILRKKFKEDLFTYCIDNGIFQDFQDTSEPSNDNTNVVNALQEPFVVKQDPEEQEANINTQPFQYSVVHQPPQEEISVEFLQEKRNQINSVKTFLRKFNRISFYEMPKVLSLAWEIILEIELAFEDKHLYINTSSWDRPTISYNDDDDEDYTISITPKEPDNSLSMGDEHLDTISAMESDEFIKSSVENLVPNPSESKGEHECDVSACDDFTTFSNILFDVDDDFSSSDDESFSDEDISKEIYSNPLFDEEILSIKIDPHHFNAESDLIESLLNHDSSIISSSSKIDSLLNEYAGELTLLKLIPSEINETNCDPKEEICLIKRLLYDNSSPRPPEEFNSENSDTAIESFSTFPIPVEDSNSFIEEIDLSFTLNDPMPSGIEEDDYDSKRDIPILKELISNNSLLLPKNESFHFDIPSSSRPPAKPPDGNSRTLNVKVMGEITEHKVPMPRLMLTQPTLVPNQEKSLNLLSHQGHEASQPSTECPMMIYGRNTPILDVLFLHFYPP